MILSEKLIFDLLTTCDLRMIAAMAMNRVIGRNNKIPWHIPSELKFFRETTINSAVLMGRKTFQSIGHALPDRENFVLTRSALDAENVTIINSIEQLLQFRKTIWICGGESIYQLLLPACKELYLSFIHETFEGDAFFPNYEEYFVNPRTIHSEALFHTEQMINKNLI